MRRLLTPILLLLASTASAGLLSIHSAASGAYSAIATTTADSVPTPRYVIQTSTGPQYTPLVAATASPGPRLSIGGNTYMLGSATPAIGGITSLVTDASGTWVVHTFLESGDLIVNREIATCEYLIVAGGGGGGRNNSGLAAGGGAGGRRTNVGTSTPIILAAGKQAIVVGAGGASPDDNTANGGSGTDSSAFGITSTGGGGGATNNTGLRNGLNGGSGGGGVGAGTGGTGIAGQGNDGATPGGGGGAGAVGTNPSGGAGLVSAINGRSTTYAAGGDYGSAPSPKSSNTGNGGDGVQGTLGLSQAYPAASGIVIVRYLIEE